MDLSKILVPVSETENSGNGLKYSIKMATAMKAEVDIFHVSEKPEEGLESMPHSDIIRSESGNGAAMKQIVRNGNPGEEIVHLATELEPELIVMTTDVFNKEKKYFEESETGKVLKDSNYPLLMLPPETEFRKINTIVLASEMKENLVEVVRKVLAIFKVLNPQVDILIISDQRTTWHFKEDVCAMIERLKDYTEYSKISGNVCDHKDNAMGVGIYAQKVNADLVCMESGTSLYYNIFFSPTMPVEVPSLLNQPILILPSYWQESMKKA